MALAPQDLLTLPITDDPPARLMAMQASDHKARALVETRIQ